MPMTTLDPRAMYRDLLADHSLLDRAVSVNSKKGPLLAIPLGGSRVAGDLDYDTTDLKEATDLLWQLIGRYGYANADVVKYKTWGQDFYAIRWGQFPTKFPKSWGDAEGHRRMGKAYGYSEAAISDLISKCPKIIAEFEKFLCGKCIDRPLYSAIPPNIKCDLVREFTGFDNVNLFGLMQLGAVAMFPTVEVVSPIPPEATAEIAKWIFNDYKEQMLDDSDPDSLDALTVKAAGIFASHKTIGYAFLSSGNLVGVAWFEDTGQGIHSGHFCFPRHSLIKNSEKVKLVKSCLLSAFAAGANRAVWSFFPDNRAFRIFLKKLGAQPAGIVRGAIKKLGKPVDVELMVSSKE